MVFAFAGDSTTTSAFSLSPLLLVSPSPLVGLPALAAAGFLVGFFLVADAGIVPSICVLAKPEVTPPGGTSGQPAQLQIHHHRRASADGKPRAEGELTDVARHMIERGVELGGHGIVRRRG